MRRSCTRAAALCAGALLAWPLAASSQVVPYEVRGDAIETPLAAEPGDPAQGRAIVADRRVGLCLLCHSGPFPEEAFQGNLAPSLAGAGARWSTGQLRLRIVDARQLNPASLMPPYHRVARQQQVGRAWEGRPVLTAQQVEHVVAFLATLKP